jgi:hypothetical protein
MKSGTKTEAFWELAALNSYRMSVGMKPIKKNALPETEEEINEMVVDDDQYANALPWMSALL